MKVVIINGPGGAGKDTFVNMVGNMRRDFIIYNCSTVDKVKKYAKELGWDGTKSPENRRYLSDLKDMLTAWNDIPFKDILLHVKSYYKSTPDGIVFIHCREPQEIDRLKKFYNATTLLIKRETGEKYLSHADMDVFFYNYDYEVDNNGTYDDLAYAAKEFISWLSHEPDSTIPN